MNLDFLKGRYSLQLWLVIMIVLISNLIFGLLTGFYLNWAEPGVDLTNGINLNNISMTSQYISIVLNQLGSFLLPALVFAGLFGVARSQYLDIRFKITKKFWLAIFPIVITSIVIMTGLKELNGIIPTPNWAFTVEEDQKQLLVKLLGSNSAWKYILNLFVLALLPALAEEFIFRGVLQKLFIKIARGKVWLGVLATACLFSFIHFDFGGFIPRVFMGIVLGYLFVWSKSLIVPILTHFLFNALQISFLYFFGSDNSDSGFDWVTLTVSILLFLAIAYRLKPTQIKHD